MSGELHVDRLRFVGPAASQEYEFRRRVTVISGPVGAGKTTILNGIAYCLGMSWTPPKKVRPALVAVEIDGRLGTERFTITRSLRVNKDTAGISIGTSPAVRLPVGGDKELSLSTILLERLDIPVIRVPQKTRVITEEDRAVSFADVLSLVYLDQDQIDGTIGFTGDRFVKWRQTAEVVYGFTTSEIAELQAELGQANGALTRVRRYINEVERFLAAVTLPGEEADLETRRRVQDDLGAVERELAQLKTDAERPYDAQMRSAFHASERALASARDAAARAVREVTAMQRVVAQLAVDVEALDRLSAASAIGELEFEQCPRCLSEVSADQEVRPGHCLLCHQREPVAPGPLETEVERRRVGRQQSESADLLREANARYEAAYQEVLALEREHGAIVTRWNEAASAALAPRLERVAALSERRGALLRSREVIDRSARMRAELSEARAERDRLLLEVKRLEGELDAARAEQRRAQKLVQLFGERYFELLQEMQMRDLETANVDSKTFVPLVNGEGIKRLSSGGMKTVASFAYFLAALQIRLAGEPSLLPRFMMIDGPRKGHGRNEADEAAMLRFYRTLANFARLSSQSDFQVIVADNDTPLKDRDQFGIIEFDEHTRSVDVALLLGDSA